MGYLAYEAAALLDGTPGAAPGRCAVPSDRTPGDRPGGGLRPLAATAHPGGARARGRTTTRASQHSRSSPIGSRMPSTPPLATVQSPRPWAPARRTCRTRTIATSSPRSRSTSSPATSTRACPSRRVSFDAAGGGFPIYRRLRVSNPAPYMFFLRMLGPDHVMELAGSSPEPLVRVEDRRVSRPARSPGTRPARSDRGTRPAARARAPRGPEGASGARDARRPRPQRPRPCVRAGQRPPDRADAGGAVLEGDAHRLDRGGRPPRGPAPARRAGRDVPGRHGDGGAQAPGDGADRRVRADPSRTVRWRRRLPHVRRRPRLLHHDPDRGGRRTAARTCRRARASWPTPIPETELAETKAKAEALLPAIGIPGDPEGVPHPS